MSRNFQIALSFFFLVILSGIQLANCLHAFEDFHHQYTSCTAEVEHHFHEANDECLLCEYTLPCFNTVSQQNTLTATIPVSLLTVIDNSNFSTGYLAEAPARAPPVL